MEEQKESEKQNNASSPHVEIFGEEVSSWKKDHEQRHGRQGRHRLCGGYHRRDGGTIFGGVEIVN